MNAAHIPRAADALAAGHDPAVQAAGDGEHLSALVDGELSVDELAAALYAGAGGTDQAVCRRYALIGQALRGEPIHAQPVSPQDFLAGVNLRLQAEREPAAVLATRLSGRSAANDAVFRWKLVAGLASLAAVVAVSWNVLVAAPGAVVAGPQLAAVQPDALPAGALAVVVNTERGPVVRDPRLEQLLAEHRQYGGMSALQMPAGFLRDATHLSDTRR
ncbi:MAG: sigma-E factor negative regulatory protein [Hydrogenophaga sp.]